MLALRKNAGVYAFAAASEFSITLPELTDTLHKEGVSNVWHAVDTLGLAQTSCRAICYSAKGVFRSSGNILVREWTDFYRETRGPYEILVLRISCKRN